MKRVYLISHHVDGLPFRQHEAEQVLTTALQSAQSTEVSPAFVTSEIDHIRTEKTQALKHLHEVQPQAVQEMETLLQTTVELKKFKVGTERCRGFGDIPPSTSFVNPRR